VPALIVGTLLALGALAYVLWPLIVAAEGRAPARLPVPSPASTSTDEHGEAVVALREIEFDHATGKLSESDYAALKTQYTSDAVAAMRARESASDDPVEAEIRRARAQTRVCPVCGPRPEPGARYCSRCGGALA
jgi:hypothetical protein